MLDIVEKSLLFLLGSIMDNIFLSMMQERLLSKIDARTKGNSYSEKMINMQQLKFIDPEKVLDEYEKWTKLYEDTILGRAPN